MQIYNLKNKLEYLDEVAKLEYDEWADNKEENRKYTQIGKKIRFIAKTYKYTNTKGQDNLGLKMYKIIEG